MKKLTLPEPEQNMTSGGLMFYEANEELFERIGANKEFSLFTQQFTKDGIFTLRGHTSSNSKEIPVILFMRNNITCCYLNPNQLAIVHTEVKRYENLKCEFEYNVLSYGCGRVDKTNQY